MSFRGLTIVGVLASAFVGGTSGGALGGDEAPSAPAAKPQRTITEAIQAGVSYLLKTQNKDGSWGSPAPTLYCDIMAYVPDHEGFGIATSALALSSLLEVGGDTPEVQAAVRKGTDWLLANHKAHRGSPVTLYNTWGHSYALEAFSRLLAREKDETRKAALTKAADDLVGLLKNYQFVDGGWGYYDFAYHTKSPGTGSTSFTTATCLTALGMAAKVGIAVPDPMVKKAMNVIDATRRPDGAYAYSYDLRLAPTMGVNKTKGSLARTPACTMARTLWGRPVETKTYTQALDELESYGHFLLIARKYPFPHETWYQNSGYFCFYGYYYATRLLDYIPADQRPPIKERIAKHLVPLQEDDGSWWDYNFYGYHKPYGTAYVLMSLGHCRPDL